MNGSLNIHPKVTASGLAGAVVVLIVYSLQTWAHVTLPDPASAALVVIFGFAAGWLAPAAATTAATAQK